MSDENNRSGTHSCYGPGVYLTEFSPSTNKVKILRNNYGGAADKPENTRKTDCYLKFYKEDLPTAQKVKGKRNVWRYPNEIDLQKISFYYGNTGNAGEEFVDNSHIRTKNVAQCGGVAVVHSGKETSLRRASPKHTLSISEFVDAFGTDDDGEDDEDDYPTWVSTSVQRQRYGRSNGTFQNQVYQYGPPSSSPRPSQQKQDAQGSAGFVTIVVGAAATIAVGAAVFGLFSAFRRNNNNQH